MEEPEVMEARPPEAAVGEAEVRNFVEVLRRYKAGKQATERRILASENWWKLRSQEEERHLTRNGADGGLTSTSAWLHNVIVSKHADAMESYPAPVILPREAGDAAEAQTLSSIIPCILERSHFEDQYSEAAWQKGKTGTGVFKVIWDAQALNGLGDIAVSQVNLLNLYWEPGKKDIQQSRYFFHTELEDREVLEEEYPGLGEKLTGGKDFLSTRFLYDDYVDVTDKVTVVEVYYHKVVEGRKTLQYCKFVSDQVLFATENDPELSLRGLYDHGLYPYVFDPLYPIEGSPCGYGYVDVCRNPQTVIDTLKTAYIKNAMVGATPRYFARGDGAVNEEEFLDLAKPLVHVNSSSEDTLRRIEHTSLDSVYMAVLEGTIQELRQTSGNTETSTGNIQSGVTAASAIAALQEASGKGIRDSNRSTYRAFGKIVYMVIELIRQFYDLPRQFRITGELGREEFLSYTNQGLRRRHQGTDFGRDMGYRMPVFDIQVTAQKRNAYSTVAQNELALQLYSQGLFDPQRADQALMCLEMMDFEGKDLLMAKIARNAQVWQVLLPAAQALPTLNRGEPGAMIQARAAAHPEGGAG